MSRIENSRLYQLLTVKAIREEANRFYSIEFANPEPPVHYLAGQYLTLVHPFRGGEERRSYSLLSSPERGEPLTIAVKRIDNGLFSRYLTDVVRPGDTLLTTGAAGLFTLPENIEDYQQIVLLAAGSGITPVFSLLKTILHTYSHLQVLLVYSNHAKEETAFYNELKDLEKRFENRFAIHFLFSTDKNIYRAHLHRDLLIGLLKSSSHILPNNKLAYVCGPHNYMRMCIYTLQELGLPPENIKKEIFDIHQPVAHQQPPDTATHIAKIHFAGEVHNISIQYPDTILKAARKQGVDLPYSCEAGMCGNCAMRCTHGEVWMSYNEVLTPRDLANKYILTCVGHPLFGDVELHT